MKTSHPSPSHREQLLAILDFFSAHHLRQEDSALVLADGTLSLPAENHPKHDPCRLFKKGDRVRLVERYGRKPDDGAPINVICDVEEDEYEDGTVTITYCYDHKAELFRVTALYLELVTPVEELEPYYVREFRETVQILRRDCGIEVASYDKEEHPHAKEAAEAERDRLNAEYRKEQNND